MHRWLGVALCVVMLLWFPSGIGMMYWRFPEVTDADRLARAPALDPDTIRLSPAEAAVKAEMDGSPGDLRLTTFDGRPAYRFFGGAVTVYADTGDLQGEVSLDLVRRTAARWTGEPIESATAERVREIDQWTIQMSLFDHQPVWKFSWPDGQQVYVSGATGDVLQYTTTASRIGAYLGPITHWVYFTPIRTRPEWITFMIWSSGIGAVAALLGLVVGLWLYAPDKRYRHDGTSTAIPFKGQKRWHTILGLAFGVATVTWAFSGMLSLDPFPSLDRGPGRRGRGGEIQGAIQGEVDMAAFTTHPREVLRRAGRPVRELAFTSFGGQPVHTAFLDARARHMLAVDGTPLPAFDRDAIAALVRQAVPAPEVVTASLVGQYDLYYRDRTRQLPLPVVLIQLHDAEKTRYYVDPVTAEVVGGYSSRNWVGRFLYNGLHSLDFPWLYNYRPLWDVVVIFFMVGGTALCATSLVLAWRVVGRTLARPFR